MQSFIQISNLLFAPWWDKTDIIFKKIQAFSSLDLLLYEFFSVTKASIQLPQNT